MSRDGSVTSYKRGVTGSNPVAPTRSEGFGVPGPVGGEPSGGRRARLALPWRTLRSGAAGMAEMLFASRRTRTVHRRGLGGFQSAQLPRESYPTCRIRRPGGPERGRAGQVARWSRGQAVQGSLLLYVRGLPVDYRPAPGGSACAALGITSISTRGWSRCGGRTGPAHQDVRSRGARYGRRRSP